VSCAFGPSTGSTRLLGIIIVENKKIIVSLLPAQAILPIHTLFLCSVDCLSVVFHIRAPCVLNRSLNVDVIWQHTIANYSQIVSPMLPLGEYKERVNDSAICLITLVLV